MHIFITIMLLFILIILWLLNNYSKNCVRLTTSSPASPKQEAPKRGRSGAGAGMCRVRRTTPSPPSQEWHGVASGEACAYAVLRTSSPASPKRLPRGGDQERAGNCRVGRPIRPHRPPSQEWHGVASGEACGVYVRVCGVWGACRTRLELYIEQNKKRH